jgi:uncharacterized membrane protein
VVRALFSFAAFVTAAFIATAPWGPLSRLEIVLIIWPIAALLALAAPRSRQTIHDLLRRDVTVSRPSLIAAAVIVAAFLIRVTAAKYFALEVNAWDFSLSFDRPLEQTVHGNFLWSEDLRQSMFAVHSNWLLLAFVIPYAIVPSPWWLLISQPLAITAAAVVLFLLLRELAVDDFVAACGALAFVLNRYTAKAVQFPFIIDTFYPFALFLLMYAVVRRNTRLMAIALLLSVSVKEDSIVPLAGIAIVAFLLRRRRAAAAILGGAIAAFAFDYFLVIPGFATLKGAAYASHWASYGATPLEAAAGMLMSPLRTLARGIAGSRDVLWSTLLVPLAGWPWSLAALPPLLVYGGADASKIHFFVLHYSMPFLPAIFASLPAGIERIARVWNGERSSRRMIAAAVLAASALLGTTYEFDRPRRDRHSVQTLLAAAGSRAVYVQGALLPHAGYSHQLHAWHHGTVSGAAFLVCDTCNPYPFSPAEFARRVAAIRRSGDFDEVRIDGLRLFLLRSDILRADDPIQRSTSDSPCHSRRRVPERASTRAPNIGTGNGRDRKHRIGSDDRPERTRNGHLRDAGESRDHALGPAVLDRQAGHRRAAAGRADRVGALHGLAHEREQVRQLARSRRAARVSARQGSRDQGLGRRRGDDEDRRSPHPRDPAGPRLRRAGSGRRDSAQRDARIQGRAARRALARMPPVILSAAEREGSQVASTRFFAVFAAQNDE